MKHEEVNNFRSIFMQCRQGRIINTKTALVVYQRTNSSLHQKLYFEEDKICLQQTPCHINMSKIDDFVTENKIIVKYFLTSTGS